LGRLLRCDIGTRLGGAVRADLWSCRILHRSSLAVPGWRNVTRLCQFACRRIRLGQSYRRRQGGIRDRITLPIERQRGRIRIRCRTRQRDRGEREHDLRGGIPGKTLRSRGAGGPENRKHRLGSNVITSDAFDLGWRSKQDQHVAECFGRKAKNSRRAGCRTPGFLRSSQRSASSSALGRRSKGGQHPLQIPFIFDSSSSWLLTIGSNAF
jgi:hypothetical protein